jgi:hypothetical protein
MAYRSKEIAYWQIKIIHVAANQLGLIHKDKPVAVANLATEEQDPYHQILSGFIGSNGKAAISCKNLNYDQANILIEIFHKLGFQSKNPRANQFESLFSKDRPDDMASVRQLGFVMGLWVQHSREKTLESLDKYCKRIIGVDHLEWLKKEKVSHLLKAIESL